MYVNDDPPSHSVEWSPDGSRIAFTGFEFDVEIDPDGSGLYGLYTVRPDGTGLTRLNGSDAVVFPRPIEWSPDGALLAFVAKKTVADGNETFAFYTVRPDGSALTQIAFFEYIVWADDNMLAWSPDGAWLAFTDHRSVYVARPDGTEVRKIADGIADKFGQYRPPLVWTPDGQEVWFGNINHRLKFAVRPDGSGLREVKVAAENGRWDTILAAWSPDGARLAVLSVNSHHGDFRLSTVTRDGAETQELVRGNFLALATVSEWQDISRDYAACSAGYVVPDPRKNAGLVKDCQTLVTIRNALAGDAFLNWGRAFKLAERRDGEWRGEWHGIEVGGDPPRVQSLNDWNVMPELTGVIPPALGDLTGLEYLNLSENSLTGEIPPELGNLSNLKELALLTTGLRGSVPAELGNLTNLTSLSLGDNELSGCIPKALSDTITELYIDDSDITGYCE